MKKKNNYWIESPFKVQEDPTGFLTMDYENLIEINSDIQLKTKFEGLLIAIFWYSIFDKISKFIKTSYSSSHSLPQYIYVNIAQKL